MRSLRATLPGLARGTFLAAIVLMTTLITYAAKIDSDGDGLSDELEETLGSNPQHRDEFITVYRREKLREGKDLTRTVKSVALANVGGNRFVWRVEFADNYPKQNSNLILYLDADNDEHTGRQQ